MDAFAVAITNGLCYNKGEVVTKKVAWYSGLTFGTFQGIMPLLGFLAGAMFQKPAEKFDHWIALILLSFIGGKMIYDAIQERRNPEEFCCPPFNAKTLLLQGVATSIDAFAVGISLAMNQMNILIIAPSIALCTFLFSFLGVYIGKHFGKVLRDKAQIIGGIVLIGIGVNVFIEHTM